MNLHDMLAWPDEGQWAAHKPSTPGVYGIGRTRDEAVADLDEALGELSSYLSEVGERRSRR